MRTVFRVFVWMVVLSLALAQAQSLPREIRQKILEAVVQIIPYDEASNSLVAWSGSGTIISSDGFILTNYHVIGDTETRQHYRYHAVLVTDPRAPEQPPKLQYWAEYVASDPTHDLAIIKITEYADETPVPASVVFTAMPVGDSNELLPGDAITVVGYPGISGSTITFTRGIMSGWLGEDLESGGKQWIKTDAKIARGNSGGAAFNDDGELIGVPTAGYHLLEGTLYEEQLYVRPISLAWALIGPSVPTVLRSPGITPPVPTPSNAVTADPSGAYGSIALNSSRQGSIEAATETALAYHMYTIDIPAGLESLFISIDAFGHDIDLAAKMGAEISDYGDLVTGDFDYADFTTEINPSYTINNPQPGTLYLDVVNAINLPANYEVTVSAQEAQVQNPLAPPAQPQNPLTLPPAQPQNPLAPPAQVTLPAITAHSSASATIGAIALGQSASGSLTGLEDGASYHTYVLTLPAGTPSLTVTMNADADLDLALKYGSEISSYADKDQGGDWDYRDISTDAGASFTVSHPQAGVWYIDVFSLLEPTVTGSYTLTIR